MARDRFLPAPTFQPARRGLGWRGILCVFLLGFGIAGILGAGSMKTEKGEIEATGRIYIMGNEPFTQVALEQDDGRVFALIGEKEKELRGLQGKRVTVTGIERGKTIREVENIEVRTYRVQKAD